MRAGVFRQVDDRLNLYSGTFVCKMELIPEMNTYHHQA